MARTIAQLKKIIDESERGERDDYRDRMDELKLELWQAKKREDERRFNEREAMRKAGRFKALQWIKWFREDIERGKKIHLSQWLELKGLVESVSGEKTCPFTFTNMLTGYLGLKLSEAIKIN